MKILFLLLSMAAFTACSTVPTAMIRPNQLETLKNRYAKKTMKEVRSDIGEPASQGHWGVGSSKFVLQYVQTTDPNTLTVPRWSYQTMKDKWMCYSFMFTKASGDSFDDLYLDTCNGGYEPMVVDFDYPNKK